MGTSSLNRKAGISMAEKEQPEDGVMDKEPPKEATENSMACAHFAIDGYGRCEACGSHIDDIIASRGNNHGPFRH